MLEKLKQTSEFIRKETNDFQPEIGIILGSGLGNLADDIEPKYTLKYADIPNFPVSTVKGHKGSLLFGTLNGKKVVAMQGRFHHYEGYSLKEVTFPVVVMKQIGVKLLVVSNASGGLNPSYKVGDVVIIKDHINLFCDNPLMGPNIDELGPRFPSMHEAYDKKLIVLAEEIAKTAGFRYQKGVYVGTPGPTFETGAECEYMMRIGGDIVGMSTVPEVIISNYLGMKTFGISVVSDMGVHTHAEGHVEEITHEEVLAAVEKATPNIMKMVKELIAVV
ncbi:purine nucleoside phosphorylase [Bacteroidia bacterium]|nr:purine nucleoside phosphorylase [Bacteroidia bacterium]